jgi:hypothetical protein
MTETQTDIQAFEAGEIGLHTGILFEDYLRAPMMSQSVLKQGRLSMLHLKHAIDNFQNQKITDAMTLGSALHCAFLEPELMPTKVALWDGPRRAGKEWDAFCKEHAGKAILTEGFHEKLVGMMGSLRKHPEIRKWTGRIQDVEVSAIGMIDGVKFKGRCDALTDDPLWDLKKISRCDERTINNAIKTYGYHIQAFIYREIFHRDRFCLAFVEDPAPHDVVVVELSPAWLKLGQSEGLGLIQAMKQCLKTNRWPGRSDKIEVIEPPEYMTNSGEGITIDGEEAFAEE